MRVKAQSTRSLRNPEGVGAALSTSVLDQAEGTQHQVPGEARAAGPAQSSAPAAPSGANRRPNGGSKVTQNPALLQSLQVSRAAGRQAAGLRSLLLQHAARRPLQGTRPPGRSGRSPGISRSGGAAVAKPTAQKPMAQVKGNGKQDQSRKKGQKERSAAREAPLGFTAPPGGRRQLGTHQRGPPR